MLSYFSIVLNDTKPRITNANGYHTSIFECILLVDYSESLLYTSGLFHFHILWYKKVNISNVNLYTKKVKCLGAWSDPRRDRNEILTAIPICWGSSYPMRSTGILFVQTGNGKSNIAASKLKVLIFQLVDKT